MGEKTYSPDEDVVTVVVAPVSWLVRVTLAPGRMPPVLSLMVPRTVAGSTCASAELARRMSKERCRKERAIEPKPFV